MKKQTAVEWLVSKLPQRMLNYLKEEIQQAKAMHKEEIVNAWNDGDYAYFYSKETGRDFVDGSEYYNETFGGNNE